MTATCESCRFCHKEPGHWTCHRRAPGSNGERWRTVFYADWCGEHEPKAVEQRVVPIQRPPLQRCAVCQMIGMEAAGYVCPRSDCPTAGRAIGGQDTPFSGISG